MTFLPVYSPEARADLLALYDYSADRAGESVAPGYISRIEDDLQGFRTFPERGTRRDDLRPGLRTVGFGRTLTIAFHIDSPRVVIDRLLYGGRDLGTVFQ